MSGDGKLETGSRRWPRALLTACVLIALVEALVASQSERFMDATPLMYREKLRWVDAPRPAEVVVFGDSSAVAAVRPSQIEAFLPAGVRVLNLGMTAVGPTGAEILLRRYLRAGASPKLAVLSFSPRSLTDDPPAFFVSYPLTHLLDAASLARVIVRSSRPAYALSWALSRLPSFRYREDLETGALSLIFDRLPELEPRYFDSLGWSGNPINYDRFQWRYTRRSQRNRELGEALRREQGWHYFREYALPSERLPDGLPLDSPPFEGARREAIALDRFLALCESHRVTVLVVPSARPAARMRALDAEGGDRRFRAFWNAMFVAHTNVHHTKQQALAWPHRYFADGAHVNPEGDERYGDLVGPLVARVYAGLPAGGDSSR